MHGSCNAGRRRSGMQATIEELTKEAKGACKGLIHRKSYLATTNLESLSCSSNLAWTMHHCCTGMLIMQPRLTG